MTLIVVVVDGCPKRACQIFVVIELTKRAWGGGEKEVILIEYKPLMLEIWIWDILMMWYFKIQKEELKLIEREGLSYSNWDKFKRFVLKWGTWSTLVSLIGILESKKIWERMWEMVRLRLLPIWSVSGPL
jgi:hypothetical protein